jgi:fatty-acyl-CoA synthase
VDKIPLTSVGKIFKPALRWDSIKRVYADELAALGNMALSVEISVSEDKSHGTRATITIRPAPGISSETLTQRIQEILARYTVAYSVDFLSE